MTRRILAATLLLCGLAHADAPPSWQPFEVESANHQFSARILVADKQGESPWQWSYALLVYDNSAPSSPQWKTPYAFDGYGGGLLSNDGTYFANTNFWYFNDRPVVTLYSRNGIWEFSGQDLHINSSGLQRTISHQLWLKDSPHFIPDKGSPSALIVETTQGERRIELNPHPSFQRTSGKLRLPTPSAPSGSSSP